MIAAAVRTAVTASLIKYSGTYTRYDYVQLSTAPAAACCINSTLSALNCHGAALRDTQLPSHVQWRCTTDTHVQQNFLAAELYSSGVVSSCACCCWYCCSSCYCMNGSATSRAFFRGTASIAATQLPHCAKSLVLPSLP
eukprot:18709-Heterococcus_DN1.PRE.5